MAMSQASRGAAMASFSFPLAKYTFSTVPTASKKWEYSHISPPPSLQLLLRPHEPSGGYCLEIVSGTNTLETVDLSRLVSLSNSQSQNMQSNSDLPVCIIYHNLSIAFKYPISTIETRRTQLKFLDEEDYLYIIEKLKKLGLQARPHQPSLKPLSARLHNAPVRLSSGIYHSTVFPVASQIPYDYGAQISNTGIEDKSIHASLSSSPIPLSSSPAPRALPTLNNGSSLSSRNSGFGGTPHANEYEHQTSEKLNISIAPHASEADPATKSRFFSQQPNQPSTMSPLSDSSMQANVRQVGSPGPGSRVETPSQAMRPPILGQKFETALTAARNITLNLERPSTAISTTSDDTVVKRYAEAHESFRTSSVQPATSQDDFYSSMPPKRTLPFPSFRKNSTLESANKSQTDLRPSGSPGQPTEKKDAFTTVSTSASPPKTRNANAFIAANQQRKVRPRNPAQRPSKCQAPAAQPSTNDDENTARLVADPQAAAYEKGENAEKGTEQPILPTPSQTSNPRGQKRKAPAPESPSPKRQITMVDQSTQTQTKSGRNHTVALKFLAHVEKRPECEDQGTQTASVSSSLFDSLQELFKKDRQAKPTTDVLGMPNYHDLPENERHNLLNNYLFECLEDPNFMKLCKDMDKCWRKVMLDPKDD